MRPELSTRPRPLALVLLLATLASLALGLAVAEPGTSRLHSGGRGALAVAPTLAYAAWRRSRKRDRVAIGPVEAGALLLLMLGPGLVELIRLALTGRTEPWEVPLLGTLRNLVLGLAALASWPLAANLAALSSLFLVLVAASLGDEPVVLALAGGYALVGSLWLGEAYWAALPRGATVEPGEPSDGGRRSVGPVGLAVVGVGLIGVVVTLGPTRAATVLAGLIPSSGGTSINDPEARGGVNDGDNEVSASENPQSIGFTESEVYLESDRPSLYDSFSEQYGEPVKPPKTQERMIAIGPNDVELRDKPTENLQAGRTFAAVRQPSRHPTGRGAEREAKALFYVKGATPLHIPLATWDRFDGVEWAEEGLTEQRCPLELVPGRGAWLALGRVPCAAFAGLVTHQIKVGRLDSSPLPIPSHVERFRVGSVNRPDFFAWAQPGLVRMAGRTVPAGTVIDTESRTVDPARLEGVDFPAASLVPSRFLDVPASLDSRVVELARGWAAGAPRGWGQVQAVVAGVRRHCRHDHEARAPAGCTDVVGHFLLGSRCGPDHNFATGAAVTLRVLGYPTRVVSGYYAAPDDYDAATRHTPVRADDVHFWAEVRLPDGTWVAVEPTPGYDLLGPSLAPVEAALHALRRLGRWVVARRWAVAAGLLGLLALGWSRRGVLDALATLRWRLAARASARGRLIQTVRLLDARSRRAGRPRPPGLTAARWLARTSAPMGDDRAGLDRLLGLADWARFAPTGLDANAPDLPAGATDREVRRLCHAVVATWTLRAFRVGRPTPRPEVLAS